MSSVGAYKWTDDCARLARAVRRTATRGIALRGNVCYIISLHSRVRKTLADVAALVSVRLGLVVD